MKTLKEYYIKSLDFKPQHPIDEETAKFICDFIYENKIEKMLEIGSGVGYSANYFALNSPIFHIDSYEKEFGFYHFAKYNSLSKKITFIWGDYLYGKTEEIKYNKYPLIFIDASKTRQREIFEKSLEFLSDNGTIIVDNIDLKRLKEKLQGPYITTKHSKNTEKILVKSIEFKNYLKSIKDFDITFFDIGDGFAVCKRK